MNLDESIPFPHGKFFLLILRFSSNQIDVLVANSVSANHALLFDKLIKNTFEKYFASDVILAVDVSLDTIEMPLTYPQIMQLANFQL